jgi:hypothetical protein
MVHHHLSSIVVIPGRLSFPDRLSFVVPSVICRLCLCTALVHPQSTRQAVALQCGGGCSVDYHCHPCYCYSSLLSFIIVVPVAVVHCHCPLLLLSIAIIPHCCPPLLSFVIIVPILVVRHHCPHPCHCFTRSPPHEQLLMRLKAGSGVIRADGDRFKVGGEGGLLVVGGPWLGWFVSSSAIVCSLDPRNQIKQLLD